MPGSMTTPGRWNACVSTFRRIAFRRTDSVSTQNKFPFAAQWLAYTFPCQRFDDALAGATA